MTSGTREDECEMAYIRDANSQHQKVCDAGVDMKETKKKKEVHRNKEMQAFEPSPSATEEGAQYP